MDAIEELIRELVSEVRRHAGQAVDEPHGEPVLGDASEEDALEPVPDDASESDE